MTLKERLTEEMKQAMKAKEKGRLSAIRMVRAAIRDKEIEKRTELDMSHTSSDDTDWGHRGPLVSYRIHDRIP